MKRKGKGLFLPCPEGAAVIWILQIKFLFHLMKWRIGREGKKTPTTSMEEFKWWQEGGTKPKDIFEKKALGIERSF